MTVSSLQGQHPWTLAEVQCIMACTTWPMGQAKAEWSSPQLDLFIISSRKCLKAAELSCCQVVKMHVTEIASAA